MRNTQGRKGKAQTEWERPRSSSGDHTLASESPRPFLSGTPPALEVRLRLRLDFISLLPLRVILSPGAVVESARTGIVKLGGLGSGQT